MSIFVLTVRDARIFVPGIAPRFTRKRVAARLRRLWHVYLNCQARRATAVMLYALDDRTLADIGVSRDEIALCLVRTMRAPLWLVLK